MDRATLARPLEGAERQVAKKGLHREAGGLSLPSSGGDGHGTAQARAWLDTFLESQALHEQHRGWLSEMAARP